MKWTIDDVPIFIAVVEQNGVTAAARALGMPKSTVSKALSRLEDALGLRLIERNSRTLRITSEGDTFYRQALMIMEQVREADAAMAGLNATPSGRLVVALPPAFCQEMVAPNLMKFRRHYPRVELDLIVSTHSIDILRDQIDLAVVVGPMDDSDLITRTLYSGRLIWVSSPQYLRDNVLGNDVEELRRHILLCEKRYGLRQMPVRLNGAVTQMDLARGISHVNDPIAVRSAILQGAGVSLLPELYCVRHFRSGELVEVATHITFDLSTSVLSVVYPSRRLMSPKTRAFLDFLDEVVASR